MMATVLLLGEPMVLLTGTKTGPLKEVELFKKSLAGAELNVAIGLTRLNHKVAYISQLGNDSMGKYIKETIEKEGIISDYINFTDCSFTGLMMKNQVDIGDPEIAYFRKGSAFSYLNQELIEEIDLTNIKHIHLTSIPLALSKTVRTAVEKLIDKAKEQGIYLSFDPNIRPSLWDSKTEMIETINSFASKVDMFLPGISEAMLLTGLKDEIEIADYYQSLGIETIIIKLGEKGAFVKDKKASYYVDGYQVEKVIDTVGAGDGFAVGVISAKLEGFSIKEAVKRANVIGAIQVTTLGDNEGLPTKEKLNDYIDYLK